VCVDDEEKPIWGGFLLDFIPFPGHTTIPSDPSFATVSPLPSPQCPRSLARSSAVIETMCRRIRNISTNNPQQWGLRLQKLRASLEAGLEISKNIDQDIARFSEPPGYNCYLRRAVLRFPVI
jgi:hypothetical protein